MRRSCLRRILFAALLFPATLAFSQSGPYSNSYQLPKVIPPSPEAQNFMRYGEIPVDYSTGVPNISVPIWPLKSRKLELPLSISYHGSGIKVNDRSSVVGLGWVLNGGGIVSRTILGYPDEAWPKPTYKTAYANDSLRTAFFATNPGILARQSFGGAVTDERDYRDWESDRFFFQLPTGESGVFRYDFQTGNLIKVPYSPVKIEKFITTNVNPYLNVLSSFKITSATGIIFYFDVLEDGSAGSTSWVVSKMISADKTDTIRFVYKSQSNEHVNPTYSSSIDYGLEAIMPASHETTTTTATYYYNTQVNSEPYYSRSKVLDSIITATTIVKFISVGDRQDMDQGQGKFRLSDIEIYDRFTGNLVRDVGLSQSYFGDSAYYNQRMRLDSLTFKNTAGNAVETYRFNYEDGHMIPYAYLSFYHSYTGYWGGIFAEDFWGYHNTSYSSSLLHNAFVPDTIPGPPALPVASHMVTDRSPHAAAGKKALLKEIQYPTGGKTVFDFEPNDAGGGYRIHKITNYTDSLLVANTKTYSYDAGTSRTPQASLYSYDVRNFYFLTYTDVWGASWNCATETTRTVAFSSSLLPLIADNGPAVFYGGVTEYDGDASGVVGKTTYSYQQPPAIPFISDQERLHSPYELDRGNYTPRLFSKEIYKKDGGSYTKVKSEANTYTAYLSNQYNTGVKVVINSEYPTSSRVIDYFGAANFCLGTPIVEYPYRFVYTGTAAIEEESLLTKTEMFEYSPSGVQTLVDSIVYTYGNLSHLQPTEQRSMSSKGDTLKTKYKYPIDYAGTAAYDSLLSRNIVTPVIEQSSYKNSVFLQSVKTNYNNWTSTLTAPQTVESKTLANSTETRLRFHSYDDKANVLSVSKENDAKISYVWGYNQTAPIAEAINAANNEIFFDGFEDAGTWNSPIVRDGDRAHTGKYSARISNYSATETVAHSTKWLNVSLTGATKYKYSGWFYSNGPYIELLLFMKRTGEVGYYTYVDYVGGTTTNKWTYVEKEFLVPADVVQLNIRLDNNQAGSVWFDDIRLHPSAAAMTTYTYNPLIGVTSKSDINSFPTYYEYDAFNRLVLIRDHEKNILKKICYNYAGQAEDCGITYPTIYSSTAVAGYYTRNDCGVGYAGTQIYCAIAANSFLSSISQYDADLKASNAAQEYANANCSCNQLVPMTVSSFPPGTCYMVEFYNTSTFELFYLYISSTGIVGYIPPGTYDVGFYDMGCDASSRTFGVCTYDTGTPSITLMAQSISIAGCNTISIY